MSERLHEQDMIWDFTTYAKRELYKFATCILFTRSKDDRVEIYLDEIATAAFEAEHRLIHHLGLEAKEVADPCDLIVLIIAGAVVHEWLHHEAHLEEKTARFATDQLYEAFLEPPSPCFSRMGYPRSRFHVSLPETIGPGGGTIDGMHVRRREHAPC